MSGSKPIADKQKTSSDKKIDTWLSKIKELYEEDGKIKEFREEEACLRAYVMRLEEETRPTGRLSACKLETPYARGGTSIIFKATHAHIEDQKLVLKFNRPRKEGDTGALIENEIHILPHLEHSNIIRVIDIGKFDTKADEKPCPPLSFILEPFISNAISLREFAKSLSLPEKQTLEDQDIADSIDDSLLRLTSVLRQWVEALIYIHKSELVYLDVKPDNAIVDKDDHLIVIDFGTAQKRAKTDESPTEIFFSELYAHPRIKKGSERTSSNRVKAAVKKKDLTVDLDHYALGKSILDLLETIATHHPHDFPQRPLFRSLHFLATRLLDGQNEEKISLSSKVGLGEIFGGLTRNDYQTIKYEGLKDVLNDLNKELGFWDPENVVPELATFSAGTLRVVPDISTALTQRLMNLIEHPLIARLKMVSQLGLITLVYPTADHSRHDHILGSYTYTSCYIRALFNDSQNCIFRNLIGEDDIKAALLASLVHDLGQYPLAHDLEEVQRDIFDHLGISLDLLSDDMTDSKGRTLPSIIKKDWGIEIDKLKRILGAHSGQVRLSEKQTVDDFKADMLSALIDGPIDADKADYITRDSTSCRVPYGRQLDIERLLNVLTTVRIPAHLGASHRVTIGIYEKGAASASAFSSARYLLYASVYWHHTSRIIKAMLQYGVAMILPGEVFSPFANEGKIKEIRGKLLHFVATLMPPADQLQQETKPRTISKRKEQDITAKPPEDVLADLTEPTREKHTSWYPGICRTDWSMLNWLKELSTSKQGERGVALIDLIQQRLLYKRVHTIHRNKTYEGLIDRLNVLTWPERVRLCENMNQLIIGIIKKKKPTLDTVPYPPMDKIAGILADDLVILVDIPDFKKIAPQRPLICVPELQSKTYYHEDPYEATNLNDALESLMKLTSPIRVLCHPDLRQWIGACVNPHDMEAVISTALDKVKP